MIAKLLFLCMNSLAVLGFSGFLRAGETAPGDFVVPRGQMTFDSEGHEGGRWHSRTPHVPSDDSGLTVGRGYDMKHRSPELIVAQMTKAGIPEATARLYSGGSKLFGPSARKFMGETKLPELTPAQQKALFDIAYLEAESSVKAICASEKVVALYGKIDWEKTDPTVRDLLVDLRYRGDYTERTRKRVQPLAMKNDLPGLATLMADREFWKSVPNDRFERRVKFLNAAAAKP
jgi:hypothetical protein